MYLISVMTCDMSIFILEARPRRKTVIQKLKFSFAFMFSQ